MLEIFAIALICGLPSTTGMISQHLQQRLVRIPQSVWRPAVRRHQDRIHELLAPGLTARDHPLNSGLLRNRKDRLSSNGDGWTATALDPQHPIYNFLIEYYGLKGAKGTRRLAQWSPPPGLLLQDETLEVESLEQLDELSRSFTSNSRLTTSNLGILLEGVIDDDFSNNLHLRGASIDENGNVIYSPSLYYGRDDPTKLEENARASSAFLWYQSILQQTLSSEPIFHCYGLHEWAMQYQPANAPPPPSAKYQKHLPLRVSRQVINETVERKGISCTHVDALRFFARDALPLNRFGGPLERNQQVRLEQPGCVHAHMDLLKMAIKLQPFCDPVLLERVLEVALEARTLDVSASPYDASSYNVGAVAIDTPEGRAQYREKQRIIMKRVEPVRRELLQAYDSFLSLAFDKKVLQDGVHRLPVLELQTRSSSPYK